MIENLTDTTFSDVVNENSSLCLVDFWATWCGPCQMMGPILETLSESDDLKGKLIFGKVNTDENPNVTNRYGIEFLPTLLFFNKGQVVHKLVGLQNKESLLEVIRYLMGA